MTDQIPADKVRAILAKRDLWAIDMIAEIEALLPTPPLPTLADMTPEDRDECQWMQADVADHDTRYVIANPHDRHGEVTLVAADGQFEWILPEYVTPRPDLPRMEWPGNTPAPALALPEGWRLADHPSNGRVIVTNTTPNIEGRVYYVLPSADPLGFDWLFCDPADLTFLDTGQGADQ